MALEFDGKHYQTISDVKEKYNVSEKTVKKLIREKKVPEPEVVTHGTRRFKSYDEAWMKCLEAVINAKP